MKRTSQQFGGLITGLAILSAINMAVWHYERALSQGEVVLLELAPVDPRSLMQGDYMRLNYAIVRDLASDPAHLSPLQAPIIVIRLDEHQVASWVSNGTPTQLGANQRRLQLRQHGQRWQIGPNSWFIEEGSAPRYHAARYGEFRLNTDGKAMLIGLRDASYQPIDMPRSRW
ncbi:MAG: GDYXXLXY domain-containing protein [Aeromonas sp.]